MCVARHLMPVPLSTDSLNAHSSLSVSPPGLEAPKSVQGCTYWYLDRGVTAGGFTGRPHIPQEPVLRRAVWCVCFDGRLCCSRSRER
jgi:hypothetical protein